MFCDKDNENKSESSLYKINFLNQQASFYGGTTLCIIQKVS